MCSCILVVKVFSCSKFLTEEILGRIVLAGFQVIIALNIVVDLSTEFYVMVFIEKARFMFIYI